MAKMEAITVHRCKVCGAQYKSRKAAMAACGSYELERPRYKVGQIVTLWHGGKRRRAKIVRRLRPMVGKLRAYRKHDHQYWKDGHIQCYGLQLIAKKTDANLEAYYFRTVDLDERCAQRS